MKVKAFIIFLIVSCTCIFKLDKKNIENEILLRINCQKSFFNYKEFAKSNRKKEKEAFRLHRKKLNHGYVCMMASLI